MCDLHRKEVPIVELSRIFEMYLGFSVLVGFGSLTLYFALLKQFIDEVDKRELLLRFCCCDLKTVIVKCAQFLFTRCCQLKCCPTNVIDATFKCATVDTVVLTFGCFACCAKTVFQQVLIFRWLFRCLMSMLMSSNMWTSAYSRCFVDKIVKL